MGCRVKKTPLRRKTPLARGRRPLAPRMWLAKGVAAVRNWVKPGIKPRNVKRYAKNWLRAYGSPERVEWINAMPCCWCGVEGHTQNAHTVGGGGSRKANAETIAPLCHAGANDCHGQYDRHEGPFALESVRASIRQHAEYTEYAWRARLKLADSVCHAHHTASFMPEHLDVCPICTEAGGVEFYAENARLYAASSVLLPSGDAREPALTVFRSESCDGEQCRCGVQAAGKVEEVIFHDDPNPNRHPLTAYLCYAHLKETLLGGLPSGDAPTDTQRLDWWEANRNVEVSQNYDEDGGVYLHRVYGPINDREWEEIAWAPTLRQALDKVIRAARGPVSGSEDTKP